MEKVSTRPKAKAKGKATDCGCADRQQARAAPARTASGGNLALQAGSTPAWQGFAQRDPLAALGGYLRGGAAGQAISPADVGPWDAGGGRGSSPARLHRGAQADAILSGFGARGAAAGNHVFIGSGHEGTGRGSVLRHELAHVAQSGGRGPDLGRPLHLGRRNSAAERQAEQAAAGATGALGAPVAADANLVQLDCPGGGCHQATDEAKFKEWEPLEFIGKGVPVKSPTDILAEQPKSIDKELEGYQQNILASRTAIFDQLDKDRTPQAGPFRFGFSPLGVERLDVEGTLPPDLKQRYGAAIAAAGAVQVGIDVADAAPPGTATVPLEAGEDARLAINAYYLALQEFAAKVGVAQAERDKRMQAAKDEETALRQKQKAASPCPTCHSGPPEPQWMSLVPDPPKLSPVPAELAKSLPASLKALKAAERVGQWKQVQTDLKASVNAMDALLIAVLPEFSKEADTLTYLKTQLAQLETFKRDHPGAKPIPAVFYPKDRWVEEKVPDGGGATVQIPQSIPWRFYLYHSSDETGKTDEPGEWTLVDMTSPNQQTNTEPTTNAADVAAGPTPDLFKQLNTKYRFPEGMLHWTYPNGSPGSLATTEPATASDWLGWIGMGLAAIALIAGTVVTFGMAAPATVPILAAIGTAAGLGAAGFGVASTVTGMQEKARYGLLTEEDKDRAVMSIAFDIIGALALGVGRLAVAAEAGARAAATGAKASTFARTLAALNGRYFFMISRSASTMKGVGLAADATQLLTTTADFIKAFNAVRAQPGLSDADRDAALVKLVSTSLLTGTLMTISVRSGIKDLGSTVHVSGIDEQGALLVASEKRAAAAALPGEPSIPAPKTVQSHLDAGAVELAPGWSRKKVGPQIDAALPEGRVEVRIVHDEAGRIVDAETFHHAGADAGSIAIHEEIAKLVRTEGEALRGLVHQQRAAFGGDPPPLELQLELKKLFDEMRAAEKTLASGSLTEPQAKDVAQKLKLLEREIATAKKAIADPSLRSAYPAGVIGVPVKPTTVPVLGPDGTMVKPPSYPDPPAGHMYYLHDDGSFGIRPKGDYAGAAKFSLEDVDGRLVASNRAHIDSHYGGRELTPTRQAELEAMGYIFQSNGVIRRPPGHATAGRPRMAPLEVTSDGRIRVVEGAESAGEVQARLREALKGDVKKLEALEATAGAEGKKVVLIEGLYDTGVTWGQVLTAAKRAQLKDILKKQGMTAPEVDRLVDGLVAKPGTLKVVFGTDPIRTAAPYRDLFSEMHGIPTTKVEVHHGDPLYLGGGHDPAMLFGMKADPHDALHNFFDNLTLPSSSAVGEVRLQATVIQTKVKSLAKPAAAIVNPVSGDVQFQVFGK